MNTIRVCAVASLCALVVPPAIAADGFAYHVTSIEVVNLGTLGGNSSTGHGINDLGDVVGASGTTPAFNVPHAFIHRDGVMSDLNDPATWGSFDGSTAMEINNSRQVVGFLRPKQGVNERAYYYQPGTWFFPLAPHVAGEAQYEWSTVALAINEAGISVGRAVFFSALNHHDPEPDSPLTCYSTHAVRWQNYIQSPQRLFCLPDVRDSATQPVGAYAHDINDSGAIVGSDTRATLHGMFLYRGKQLVSVPPPALAQHFDDQGEVIRGVAYGINDKNFVVGSFGRSVATHAFIWDGASAQSQVIPFLPNALWNEAYAINAQRMVVGLNMLKLGSVQVEAAFLWHADFGAIQLPGLAHLYPESPAWAFCTGRDINDLKDSGLVQVAGTCHLGTGQPRAVRWDIHVSKVRKP